MVAKSIFRTLIFLLIWFPVCITPLTVVADQDGAISSIPIEAMMTHHELPECCLTLSYDYTAAKSGSDAYHSPAAGVPVLQTGQVFIIDNPFSPSVWQPPE